MTDQPPKPRRRWFQFSLRTLLIVVTLVAGLLVAWRVYIEPYRRQRQTMKLTKKPLNPLEKILRSELGDSETHWFNRDGKDKSVLRTARTPAFSLALWPDGSKFATSSGSSLIEVWDAATRQKIHEFEPPGRRESFNIAVNSDGTILAFSNRENHIELWDTATWTERTKLTGHTDEIVSLAFSPDRLVLASAAKKNVWIWNVADGTRKAELKLEKSVRSMEWSPDGKRLVLQTWSGGVHIWEPMSQNKPVIIPKPHSSFGAIGVSPQGTMLATSINVFERGDAPPSGVIHIRDLVSGKVKKTLHGSNKTVSHLLFTKDEKRLIAAYEDGTLLVFDLATAKSGPPLWGHPRSDIVSLVSGPVGKTVISCDKDGFIRIWNVREMIEHPEKYQTLGDERLAFFYFNVNLAPNSVAITGDGSTLVTIGARNYFWAKSQIRIWDTKPLRLRHKIVDKLAFWPATISPDGMLLAYCTGYKLIGKDDDRQYSNVVVVDLKTYERKTLVKRLDKVRALAFLPDSNRVVTAAGSEIATWDVTSGKKVVSLDAGSEKILAMCVFGDGKRVASGGADMKIKIWDLGSKKLLRTLADHKDPVTALWVSSNGSRLASYSDKIRIWDANTGNLLNEVESEDSDPDIAILPDGKTLVYSTRSNIVLWDMENGKTVRKLHGHLGWIDTMVLTSDGKTVVTADIHGAVRLWDVP